MTRARMALMLALAVTGGLAFRAQSAAPQAAYRFQPVAPGIYSAIGTGAMNVGSNSAVIVNADDVVIVDSHISPASGRAMLQEVRSITDRPVRFLVNTHFHYDHVNGNQAFAPAADIIGHDYTRQKLTGDVLHRGMFADVLRALPRQLDDLEARAANETDASANTRLDQQLRVQRAYAESLKDLALTPPTVVLDDRMTLYRGDREIRLLFLGRGHTGGDVVVYLPKEHVLCSGDLLVNGLPNLIDGFINDWPDTLDKLKTLDFERRDSGTWGAVQGQGTDRVAAGLLARLVAAGVDTARAESVSRGGGHAHRHDAAQSTLRDDSRSAGHSGVDGVAAV